MTHPKLHYITVATKPHIVLNNIKKRIEKQGEEIIILGGQEDRNIGWNATGNFGVKLREVRDYIFKPHIKHDDIVLFTDAYDVIYGGNLREIRQRYEDMRKPIVFGSETECNPDPNMKQYYKKIDEQFSYLNSGMFIGKAYALQKLLQDYEYNDKHDDQLYWTQQFLKNPDLISLDYRNEIFLNTYGVDTEKIRWDRNHFDYNGKNPQFVHVNGPDKNDLLHFL
jgi:hypothetical protein